MSRKIRTDNRLEERLAKIPQKRLIKKNPVKRPEKREEKGLKRDEKWRRDQRRPTT